MVSAVPHEQVSRLHGQAEAMRRKIDMGEDAYLGASPANRSGLNAKLLAWRDDHANLLKQIEAAEAAVTDDREDERAAKWWLAPPIRKTTPHGSYTASCRATP